MMKKGMTKFEIKAFECELLGDLYRSLDMRKEYYQTYDHEKECYVESDDLHDIEKCAIIDDLMKKLEKML